MEPVRTRASRHARSWRRSVSRSSSAMSTGTVTLAAVRSAVPRPVQLRRRVREAVRPAELEQAAGPVHLPCRPAGPVGRLERHPRHRRAHQARPGGAGLRHRPRLGVQHQRGQDAGDHPAAAAPDARTADQRAVRPGGRHLPEDIAPRPQRAVRRPTAAARPPWAGPEPAAGPLGEDAGLALRAAAMQAGEYEAFRRIAATLQEQAPDVAAALGLRP